MRRKLRRAMSEASLEEYNDIKEGDTVECFVMEEIER